MSEPDPGFDAYHPSGQVLFRSSHGGYLHSVILGDEALAADVRVLAAGVMLAAEVSHLRAVMEIRREIVEAGFTPSGDVPTPGDLERAEATLAEHRLR
ncbi:MAG TPA: DUF2694 family protein [Mycobacterium sp.]|nr:MAG: DUF2694 domain-containing protein [Mycobacterium sp.]HOB48772.1 DUF2694 family protein [Mycobacterium sp.]HPZ95174.1 DUF2694 family protein [Mycobacterium sp.]HQE14367.1 DUF2694 family protein [Mycobacterium sp.]